MPVKTHVRDRNGRIVQAEASVVTPADIESIHAWFDESRGGPPEFQDTWFITPTSIATKERHCASFFKVEAAGDIQGLATFYPKASGFGGEPELYIGRLESAPWNRKKLPGSFGHITAAILEAAIHESQKSGLDGRISLVASENPLIERYARYGLRLDVPEANYMVMDSEQAGTFLRAMEAERGS